MENRKQSLITGIFISIFFAFTVLFYGPLSQYLPNAEELWFGLGDVLGIILPTSLIAVALAAVFFFIVPPEAAGFFLELFFGISLAFYVQGNYLRSNYGTGLMDGTEIDWSKYTAYGIFNIVLWAVLIAVPFIAAWFLRDKKGMTAKVLIIASLFLTAVQIPALAVQAASFKPNGNSDLKITTKGIYELSEEDNVVMFVIDTLDEKYYESYVDKHPEFVKKMTGFTSYDNTLASGSRTTIGMPSMLTGIPYKRQSVYSDYISKIYSDDNPLSMLNDAGYDVGVYSETILFSTDAADYVSNFTSGGGEVSSWKIFAKKIYKLDLCKFMPHFLKKYIWFDTAEFESARESADDYSLNDVKFYNGFKESGFSYNKKKKTFRLYHLYGMHQPYTLSSDVKRVKKSSCEEQTIGTMKIIDEMLDDLRDKGLYDKATIIITADHGDYHKAEHSALLIKEPDDAGEYRVSHVPASAFDLTLYLAGLTGNGLTDQLYGIPLSSLKDGMERERHMFHNTTNGNKFVIDEYVTSADASDYDSLKKVKKYNDLEDENTPYVLGTELSFRTDATGNKYCLEGMMTSTGFRCVFCGPYVLFSMPIKDLPSSGDLTAHFELHKRSAAGLKMVVTANGEEVFNGVTDEKWVNNGLDLTIPVSVFKDSNKLELKFSFPEISNDEMELKPRARTETISFISMVINKE